MSNTKSLARRYGNVKCYFSIPLEIGEAPLPVEQQLAEPQRGELTKPRPTAGDKIASQISALSPERATQVFRHAAMPIPTLRAEAYGIAYDERYVRD